MGVSNGQVRRGESYRRLDWKEIHWTKIGRTRKPGIQADNLYVLPKMLLWYRRKGKGENSSWAKFQHRINNCSKVFSKIKGFAFIKKMILLWKNWEVSRFLSIFNFSASKDSPAETIQENCRGLSFLPPQKQISGYATRKKWINIETT